MLCSLLVLTGLAVSAGAGPLALPPESAPLLLGCDVHPAADLTAVPWPASPGRLVTAAPAAGAWDVRFFLFTARPFTGAWSVRIGLRYDGRPDEGIDVEGWEAYTDAARPGAGWPEAGSGAIFDWNLERCHHPDQFLWMSREGWWVLPVLRLRVVVHGPDRLTLGDVEPGVPPHIIECWDEEHDLDGTEASAAFIPAVFGAGAVAAGLTGAIPATWGRIKALPWTRR